MLNKFENVFIDYKHIIQLEKIELDIEYCSFLSFASIEKRLSLEIILHIYFNI